MKTLYNLVAIIALSIFACALPSEASAQLRYGFRFGGDFAKASLKIPNLSPNASAEQFQQENSLRNGSGFSGGLALEYQFEKCGFAPDIALLYTRFNTQLSLPEQEPRSFGRNFIEVPIRLKWKFWIPQTKNLFAPMIYTGPSLMFRLDHNDGIPYPAKNPDSYPAQAGRFKSSIFQPGWDVGIGFDVINFIQVAAGYRFGLGNALSEPSGMTLRTNAWTLSATILFDF